MKTPTLAEKMGISPAVSPLLSKARSLGLTSAGHLENLAVARGCSHYRTPDFSLPPEISEAAFSNEELAIALLSPVLPYSPHTIRVGAAMLGATGNDVSSLSRMAGDENNVAVVRYITEAALTFEPENPFWQNLLASLPAAGPIDEGVLPHRTRFVSMPGMGRGGVRLPTVWLRPRPEAILTHG